jgi:metal-responsive CopG/Arc/MetJ family transcriptional regulator
VKEKTSITLSTDVLAGIDQLAGSKHSRSSFIERVLRSYLRQRARAQVQARDLDRLNQAAHKLNAEAADVIEYQGMDADPSADRSAEE